MTSDFARSKMPLRRRACRWLACGAAIAISGCAWTWLVPAAAILADDVPGADEPSDPAEWLPFGKPPAAELKRLSPEYPVWIDPLRKRVVMVGEICLREGPLEMFACLKGTKEHESIVAVPTKAQIVHAGLLAIGAEQGRPVSFHPEYRPATGEEIEVFVYWTNEEGVARRARAQDWIRNQETGQAMAHTWVFAGSDFWRDERDGSEYYMAEDGDFICVSNFPSAMLDLPIESTQSDEALLYRAWTERIPELGTQVTVVLAPKGEKNSD